MQADRFPLIMPTSRMERCYGKPDH